VVAGAKETQLVPAPLAGVGAQSREIGGSNNSEVKILSEMMSDTIRTIEPGGAHGASPSLLLSEHEVIDDQRAIVLCEEFDEADAAHRRIPSVEVAWTLFKLIVLNRSTFRKSAAKLGDTFALTHELDFGKAKLLALGQIFGRLVGQIRLPKRSINYCVNH